MPYPKGTLVEVIDDSDMGNSKRPEHISLGEVLTIDGHRTQNGRIRYTFKEHRGLYAYQLYYSARRFKYVSNQPGSEFQYNATTGEVADPSDRFVYYVSVRFAKRPGYGTSKVYEYACDIPGVKKGDYVAVPDRVTDMDVAAVKVIDVMKTPTHYRFGREKVFVLSKIDIGALERVNAEKRLLRDEASRLRAEAKKYEDQANRL